MSLPLGRSPVLSLWICLLLVLGVGLRVTPQLMGTERLLQHFPSEDGYLMLTIARNLALGLGMSTAEGTLPTNGTQPFTTFVWALGFWLVDGDKVLGVTIALWLQFAASLVAAFLLWRLGRIVLGSRTGGNWIAAVAAVAWLASQRTVVHGMNCLESGFYVTALLAFANLMFAGGLPFRRWTVGRALGLGLALGGIFWVRIDAVFLIAAVCLSRWLLDERLRWAPSRANLVAACITGATSVAIASPWLLYNKWNFGSFTPVSGTAQSFRAGLGDNVPVLVNALLEYVSVVVPFPNGVLGASWFVVGGALVLAIVAAQVVKIAATGTSPARVIAIVFGLYGLALAVYYGFVFGAAHFVSRYTFPVSPFLALGTTSLVVQIGSWLTERRRTFAYLGTGVVVVAVVAATNWRAFQIGARHQHWQVVEFARELPASTWVSAVQTGTLGFFHDRTLNLDGKVNPEALAALLRGESAWHRYIADSPADYVIDWVGMARFPIDHPDEYRGKFVVKIEDFERNLAVLERVGRH